MFISTFNNVDPGLQTTLLQLFQADSKILEQAFQQNSKVIDKLADFIPGNIAPAIKECKKRCKLYWFYPRARDLTARLAITFTENKN